LIRPEGKIGYNLDELDSLTSYEVSIMTTVTIREQLYKQN